MATRESGDVVVLCRVPSGPQRATQDVDVVSEESAEVVAASGIAADNLVAESAKQQLISHWSTQLRFQRDVVILALRRDDVADLNRLARGKMLDGRRLGPEALIVADREFRTGDRVVFLRNQRTDGLLNGLRGVVTAVDPKARSLTVRMTDGTDRTVPANYLDAGHLDHGYAMTIHKAQGLTADEALVLATDDLYQEAAYTALSRARLETRVYVVADALTPTRPST